jgi:hypothetical protein
LTGPLPFDLGSGTIRQQLRTFSYQIIYSSSQRVTPPQKEALSLIEKDTFGFKACRPANNNSVPTHYVCFN